MKKEVRKDAKKLGEENLLLEEKYNLSKNPLEHYKTVLNTLRCKKLIANNGCKVCFI